MNRKNNPAVNFIPRVSGGLTAVAMVAVLGTPVAMATTFVAGSACQAVNGNYGSQVLTSNGAVSNRSTTGSLQVSCPIPSYINTYIDEGSVLDIGVMVRRNTSALMTCAAVSRREDDMSGFVVSQTGRGTSFYFDNVHTLGFNTVRCTIPTAATSSPSRRNSITGYTYATGPDR
jgi:hypothetical protein